MKFQALVLGAGLRLCLLACLLVGCESRRHHIHHDPTLKIQEKKYDSLLTTPPLAQKAPKIFKKKKPPPLPPEMMKKVSLTSTNQLPIQDVLMELAHQTQVGMIMDPSISEKIMLQAHNQKFIDLLRQICSMANLRYHLEGSVLHIQPDNPYLKTYNVQFLNITRQNDSKISIATDVFSSMKGINSKNGDSQLSSKVDNGSNTLLRGQSKVNFWEELEMNLAMILGDASEGKSFYSIHRQAGIISVKASDKIQKRVASFLKLLGENIAAQVLIEAKIVEVTLSDEYKSGINWHSIRGRLKLNAPFGEIATPGAFDAALSPTRDILSIGTATHSLTAIANLLSSFGTVRTLSNPRITVLNNQPAVLKVATNQVFFQVSYNRELATDKRPETERAHSDIQTVPIGLVMVVQPSINTETGKITLNLRPTISRVTSFKEDPAVGILTNNKSISKNSRNPSA